MYIKVKVVPGAKREKVSKIKDNTYNICVKELAERNLANNRVREILANEFRVSVNKIKIINGHHSSIKMFSIILE